MRLCFPIEKRKTAFCRSETRFVAVLRFAFRKPMLYPPALRPRMGFHTVFFQALIDRTTFDYNCHRPASMNPMRPMNDENCVFPFSSFLTMEFQKR